MKKKAPPITAKSDRPNLTVAIKDFGPISSGKVELKPLTVFIGPNNSGKSYTAILIHALLTSMWRRKDEAIFPDDFNTINQSLFQREADLKKALIKTIRDAEKRHDPQTKSIVIDNNIIEEFIAVKLEAVVEKFSKELSQAFSSSLPELRRDETPLMKLDIIKDRRLRFSMKNRDGKFEIFKQDFPTETIAISTDEITNQLSKFEMFLGGTSGANLAAVTSEMLGQYLLGRLNNLFVFSANDSIYLPASRTGLVQSYKLLTRLLWKKLPEMGVKGSDGPQSPKLISDFLMNMLNFPGKESPYFDIARQLEKEILQGEISIVSNGAVTYPELRYRSGKLDIPIHRASSMVSEIAPLVLYLKYLVGPKSVLIIEEPEAHLHPQNQLILAKYLVRLVRQGLNLIITTHSDYLLEQLGSFIMLSGIAEKERKKKYGYGKDDYLTREDIGVYVFKKQPRLNAFKIEPVEVNERSGISMDEFSKVLEAFYDQTIKIRTAVQGKRGD